MWCKTSFIKSKIVLPVVTLINFLSNILTATRVSGVAVTETLLDNNEQIKIENNKLLGTFYKSVCNEV